MYFKFKQSSHLFLADFYIDCRLREVKFLRREMNEIKSKSSQKITVLTFQDEKFEAESVPAINDLETIKLLKMRRRIQVNKDGRDATPTTLTENDLIENDKIKMSQNFFHEQQFENRFDVNVDVDLNDIVNEVSCVFFYFGFQFSPQINIKFQFL